METLNYRVDDSKVFEYIVEYLHVTARTHSFKGYRVYAKSKAEAISKCPKMTITGRVLKIGYETISGLREVVNADYFKSDRGCRVF